MNGSGDITYDDLLLIVGYKEVEIQKLKSDLRMRDDTIAELHDRISNMIDQAKGKAGVSSNEKKKC